MAKNNNPFHELFTVNKICIYFDFMGISMLYNQCRNMV